MFARDPVTKVVINTEDSYYKALVARRQDKKKNQQLEGEIKNLRSELSEIKELLQQVVSGKNYG